MVSKIFHVVVSDQYAEKYSLPNTLHLGPSPSSISKRQLPVSSTIVNSCTPWGDPQSIFDHDS